eukprot:Skav218692  [mRNA]  locus=scaffold1346:113468:118696:- [translate_table: standard]
MPRWQVWLLALCSDPSPVRGRRALIQIHWWFRFAFSGLLPRDFPGGHLPVLVTPSPVIKGMVPLLASDLKRIVE